MAIKAISQFTITDLYDGERGLDGLQGEQGLQGIPGNSAKLLTLNSTKNVVAFNKDNSPKDSTDIILSAFQQNFKSNITWTSNPNVNLLGTGNTRTLSASNFVSNNQITITIKADDLSDSITIVKVQDGAPGVPGAAGSNGAAGQDAYTIVLSNESHTFAGNTTSALASNTKSEVMAYKGSQRIAATIGTITGLPDGMTAPITNNNTINAYFSPTVTSSMKTKNGVLTIPITVDGKTFTKYFTYSLSLQGLQGNNGKTSYFHIKYSPVSSPTSDQMTETPDVYIGTYVDYTESDSTDPSKYTWSRFEGIQGTQGIPGTNGANGKTSYLHIAYADNSTGTVGFDIANSVNKLYIGQYTDFNPNDSTDPSVYSWTKIKGDTGATGAPGANGVGITSIDVYYYLSTSSTTTTGGTWQTTSPGWVNGKYLWSKTVTTLTNGASTTSTPVCITGAKGATGATGASAKLLSLTANRYAVAYTSNNTAKDTTDITLTALQQNDTTAITWSTTPSVTLSGTGNTRTLAVSNFNSNNQIKITVTAGSLSDTITIVKVQDGTNGSKGSDGKGIKSTEVTYQASSSGTTNPGGAWSSTIPSVSANQYLWTRTVITYTDNSTSTSYSIGKMGANGNNGTDGKGIKSTEITYQASSGGTTVPTGTWNTSIPSVAANQYLWTRTIITYTDSTTSVSYSIGKMGATGAKGTNGADAYTIILSNESHTFAGDTSKAIAGNTSCYVVAYKGATQVAATIGSISGAPTGMTTSLSNNGTTSASFTVSVTTSMTTKSGTLTIPVTVDGKSFTKTFSYSLSLKGSTGATGATGQGIESVTELYYLADGKTTADRPNPPTNWVTTPPTWSSGKYIWTCSKIVYKNPASTVYTTPLCDSSWEAVNEIEIGGKNLVLKSDEQISDTVYAIKTYTMSEDWIAGETYTLTLKGNTGSTSKKFGMWQNSGSIHKGYFSSIDGISSITFVASTPTSGWERNFTIYNYPSSVSATGSIEWVKLEKGNKATDWTPAPEDIYDFIGNETQEITKKYETAIDQKASSIELSVSELYTPKADTDSLEQTLRSLIEQTANDITFKFDGANGYTTEIDGKLQEFIDRVSTYIQFNSDGISLGKIDNPFIASLGNTELSFLQDGVKVAYISNNKLYITDAEVRNKLTIGNTTNGFFDFIPRQNGNLSLKWRAN